MEKITDTIPEPRENYKPHAPKLIRMKIKKDYIGAIIGPGGKKIQELQADTDTTITIEEIDAFGYVEISGTNQELMDKAVERINQITFEPEVGDVFEGTVKAIRDFGAFVEIAPGFEALLHISEIEHRRLKSVDEVLNVGDKVKVKVVGTEKNGKLRLSHKVLIPKEQKPKDDKLV